MSRETMASPRGVALVGPDFLVHGDDPCPGLTPNPCTRRRPLQQALHDSMLANRTATIAPQYSVLRINENKRAFRWRPLMSIPSPGGVCSRGRWRACRFSHRPPNMLHRRMTNRTDSSPSLAVRLDHDAATRGYEVHERGVRACSAVGAEKEAVYITDACSPRNPLTPA